MQISWSHRLGELRLQPATSGDQMAYAEAITAVSGLTAGQTVQVRVIASPSGFVRVYDPTLGGSVSAASANLPTMTVESVVTQEQQNVLVGAGSNTTTQNGPLKVKIVP